MIGCYDFCGHYDWTFEWLRKKGGEELVREYWREAIASDSQQHAMELISREGIEGMKKYWGHTLDEEAAGYTMTATDHVYRIDMHRCPSKGFLISNGIVQFADYCDHCIGWIGPIMEKAGFVVDHEHNHQGQCWWEMRKADDSSPPSSPGEMSGKRDIRLSPEWNQASSPHDVYERATDCRDKKTINPKS